LSTHGKKVFWNFLKLTPNHHLQLSKVVVRLDTLRGKGQAHYFSLVIYIDKLQNSTGLEEGNL
jgi:hypothetical protein